ncbi:uncharacterized protein ARMOST_00682 [Armillaria ostoyae]|uniref:Uncharacterized protein n=1 Tax=Armillaria ostoyae TaxID=47428 RepID=A0A284QLU6_ARMOS|nr:uncharacterized protein ARMOST_00682 [Armillaria ostoyae]
MNFYQPFMPHHPLNLPLFNTSVPKRTPLPKRVPLWANQRARATKTAKVTKLTNDPPKRTVPHRKYGRETIAEALRRRNTSIGAARTTKLPGCNPPLPDGHNIPSSQADNVDELVASLDSTHLYILTAHRCQMAFDTNLSPDVMREQMRAIEDHDAAAAEERLKRRLRQQKAAREEQRKKAEKLKKQQGQEAKRRRQEQEQEQERKRKLEEEARQAKIPPPRAPPLKPTREESPSAVLYRLYELKWAVLKSGNLTPTDQPIFSNFPWPCFETISAEEDLTSEKVRRFLLDPARPNAKDKSKKEIIKEELLRWHPDKFVKVLPLVYESEREKVSAAAKTVGRVITDLLPEFARA